MDMLSKIDYKIADFTPRLPIQDFLSSMCPSTRSKLCEGKLAESEC